MSVNIFLASQPVLESIPYLASLEIVAKFLSDSKEEAINFYSKPENYKSLLSGDIGSNLLAKYITKALLVLNDIFTTIFYVIRNKFNKSLFKRY